MKNLCIICLFTCVQTSVWAQVNFVKNPSFEDTVKCPNEWNQINYSKYWSCAVDTIGEPYYAPEYHNACAVFDFDVWLPQNNYFFQYSHTGNAMVGAHLYYDKTPPSPAGLPSNWRDYFQGHLVSPLLNGKTYCVSFWVVLAEVSGYAHDNIGAYLDNGIINKRSPAGIEITDVVPQVYSSSIIKDTMNWTKIEGSFVATGNETHITLGNFAKNIDVDTYVVPYFAAANQYSYYLFDDIAVIPIDLPADAGLDTWVELGKQVKIGRTKDSATAMGLDCKWYHKGILIDSGAVISVNASSIKNAIDTYVVVQTICGIVKRDTVLVKTTGLGIKENSAVNTFSIYPNPSSGAFTITSLRGGGTTTKQYEAKVYDLLGRAVHQQQLHFANKEASLKLNVPSGTYILELCNEEGNMQRERIVVQ
jgi:hypothetical protein